MPLPYLGRSPALPQIPYARGCAAQTKDRTGAAETRSLRHTGDFFVFQLSDEILVRFAYDPAYLPKADTYWTDDSAARVARRVWGSSLSFVDVVLDGGSIAWEPSTRRAVVTERVLRDNPSLVGKESLGEADRGALDPYADAPAISHEDAAAGAEALADVLNAALGRDDVAVVIVPEEPGAPTLGHVRERRAEAKPVPDRSAFLRRGSEPERASSRMSRRSTGSRIGSRRAS